MSGSASSSAGTVKMQPPKMFVTNRHGEKEAVYFDKILGRITKLAEGLHPLVDPVAVSQSVINGLYCGITTSQLDDLAAQTCAYMAAKHPDFSKLAARIAVSNLHKNTESDFAHTIHKLHHHEDINGHNASLISEDVYEFVTTNAAALNEVIDYSRDLEFDYFAFKTLERGYLLKLNGRIVERPQHMFLRVACGIHCGDLERVKETYDLMSRKFFTHATPTLFNAGTPRPQMSSCFLLQIPEDSIQSIFETLTQCALISKSAGGIGLAVHRVRATGTYIAGTNGYSNGLVPMLKVYNNTARYVDQGGGKRKGSFAIYLEPWHADIFEFIELKRNHGKEEHRARDLFYALWVPDLFMRRVKENKDWSLMCPHQSPGLCDTWGKDFEALYEEYEKQGRAVKTVKAQALWFAICQSQIETGTPFLVYKDACNRRSNQQNCGTIQCSNLCTEIVQYTSGKEVAVCNLASLALPRFVKSEDDAKGYFDYDELHRITKIVTRNLNKVIDRNYYPIEEARVSNQRHRPIGIGVQGFADVLLKLRLPYEAAETAKLNAEIFETIYHAAVEASCDLAEEFGPYESFKGSPASQGLLQFDLFNKDRRERGQPEAKLSGRWDWESLRKRVVETGMRNSLLVAPMPTASTSQILGNCESFEPYTSNIYSRRTLSGEYVVVNPHLLSDLIGLGLWDDDMKQRIIAANGSVQRIVEIPAELRELYKTTWEIKQRSVIDLAVGRMPFIDQSQSLNLYLPQPTFAKLSSMHFYAWNEGLKTGIYYLRTTPAVDAIKFTVGQSVVAQQKAASAVPAAPAASTTTTTTGENSTPANGVAAPQLPAVAAKGEGVAAAVPAACPMRKRRGWNGANGQNVTPGRAPDGDEENFCLACSG